MANEVEQDRRRRIRRITDNMANGNLTYSIEILFEEENADEPEVVITALQLVVALKKQHPDKTVTQIVDLLCGLIERGRST